MPESAPDRQPDYFDRLLARHRSIGNAGAGRTRPRLPGPFERAEPRWTETVLPEDPTPPPAAYAAGEPAGPPSPGPIRVERYTEIRTGPPTPSPGPPPANPRWITRPTPDPASVPASASPSGSAERPTASGPTPARPAAVRPAPTGPTVDRAAASPAPAPAVPAGLRSNPSPATRRAAAPPAVPRRRTRPAEPAVHIRIGRLEVRAGTARPPVTGPRAGRPAPAVSLSDYLSANGSAPRAEGLP